MIYVHQPLKSVRFSSSPGIVLGSSSIYRRKLLENAGVAFTVDTAPVDETAILPPRDLGPLPAPAWAAVLRAEAKGRAVGIKRGRREEIVIGADQTLGLDDRIFDKAQCEAAARAHLEMLRGRTHHLFSAYTFCVGDEVILAKIVAVPLTMRKLSDDEISTYLATGEWRGSVGAYKIEGMGIRLMSSVGGESSAIIGLPLPELFCDLRLLGWRG